MKLTLTSGLRVWHMAWKKRVSVNGHSVNGKYQSIGLNAAINDDHDHKEYSNKKEKNHPYGGVSLSYAFS